MTTLGVTAEGGAMVAAIKPSRMLTLRIADRKKLCCKEWAFGKFEQLSKVFSPSETGGERKSRAAGGTDCLDQLSL